MTTCWMNSNFCAKIDRSKKFTNRNLSRNHISVFIKFIKYPQTTANMSVNLNPQYVDIGELNCNACKVKKTKLRNLAWIPIFEWINEIEFLFIPPY